MANKNRVWAEWYRLIQGRDILFLGTEFKFNSIPEGLWKDIQKRASLLLKERPNAAEADRQHWQSLVDGVVPFNLTLESKSPKRRRSQDE